MKKIIHAFLGLTCLWLSGCLPNDTAYPLVWLSTNDDHHYLIVNDYRHENPSTCRIFPLDITPVKNLAESPEEPKSANTNSFIGEIIGIDDAGIDGQLTLFFNDGSVFIYDAPSAMLQEKIAPTTDKRFLAATFAHHQIYALTTDHTEQLQLCVYNEKSTWTPINIPLPFITLPPLFSLTTYHDHLLFSWRNGHENNVLAGWQAAQLLDDQWVWLPAPPKNFYHGVFATSNYQNALFLAQENPPEQKITVAKLANNQWTQLPPLNFAPEIFSAPAYSLAIAVNDDGLTMARSDENGVHLLFAAPNDFGQALPSPIENRSPKKWQNAWWLLFGVLLFFMLSRRWFLRRLPTVSNDSPTLKNFSAAYQESLKIIERLHVGGIAKVFDRALAMMVDGAMVLALPYGYLQSESNWHENVGTLSLFFIWLCGMIIYTTLTEMFFGCTLGKALFKLRVRNANGGRASSWQIFVRNIFRVVDFFPLVIGGVNLWYLIAAISAYSTRLTQRIGDLVAGTVVRYHTPLAARKIVLASASEQRRILLKMFGLEFTQQPAETAENIIAQIPPPQMALRIAEEKATAVLNNCGETDLIIAADTLVVSDDKILGKPENIDHARVMLKSLAGKTHLVITAVVIIDKATGQHISDCALSEVTWRGINDEDIEQYLLTNEWQNRAGSYAIQGEAQKFLLVINGSLSNVIGLPLELLRDMFNDLDA